MRAGLTLAELLVVLAIIAALSAVVLPAFGMARAMARRVACHSNLRQVGMAVLTYAGDHGDRLPAERTWGDEHPDTSPAWFFRLPTYTDQRNVRGTTIFQCPAFRWQGPVVFTNASPKSYKLNGRLDDAGRPRHYRLGAAADEHRIVLFADAVAGETGMGQWGYCPPSAVEAARHRGANVLMLDGTTLTTRQRPADGDWGKALRWISEDWGGN